MQVVLSKIVELNIIVCFVGVVVDPCRGSSGAGAGAELPGEQQAIVFN